MHQRASGAGGGHPAAGNVLFTCALGNPALRWDKTTIGRQTTWPGIGHMAKQGEGFHYVAEPLQMESVVGL